MARPLRVCLAGALHHVIARGNNRGTIFRTDADCATFIHTLASVVSRYGWLCHGYCLMANHYHLVIETPVPNLPRGMRQLNGVYAQRFNRKYDRCGHLFEARYRAVLVEKETHLLAVCRYVVLNPARAGLCEFPGDWPWSSYRATAGEGPIPSFLSVDGVLARFGPTRMRACERYKEFVASGLAHSTPMDVRGERLGSDELLGDDLGLQWPLDEVPREQWLPTRPALADIFAASNGTPFTTAYRKYGYPLREIAAHLGCHYATVSRRLRREEALLDCKT